MSNVESLRALTAQMGHAQSLQELADAWRRGEVDLSPLVAPEVIYEDHAMPDHVGETYRGHEGIVEGLEQFSEVFESWEIRPQRALDMGDQVLTLGTFKGRARTSGVEWEQEFSQLVTLQRGQVVRDRFFYSWQQGFRAAGLEPKDWT